MAERADAIVVGASFAGLACAETLADLGFRAVVLERKADAGQAVHTTGIVVKEAADALDLPDALTRAIDRVRLYAPSLRAVDLRARDYFFLATDTPAALRHLAARAAAKGADLRFSTPFAGADTLPDGRLILPGLDLTARFLVGADGPRSRVAETFGLGRNRRFLVGLEAEFRAAGLPCERAFHCFLNQDVAPGYLGWVVPGVGVVQVGLAARPPAKPDLDALIAHIRPAIGLDAADIVARRAGRIPIGGTVRPVWRGNVFLVGDAAGTVSPLSAGGIHMADHHGRRLARLIAAYARGQGPHPGPGLARGYPGFALKHAQRFAFDRYAANWLIDALIDSPAMRLAARTVFFRGKRLPPAR